jgi:hypothetical protein
MTKALGVAMCSASLAAGHRVPEVEQIMRRHRSVDPDTRGKPYRDDGRNTFDERAIPFTTSELERERARRPTQVV